jgi:hypothetical protein
MDTNSPWKELVHRQRTELAKVLHAPIARLAEACARAWGIREQLNQVLIENFRTISFANYVYVLDADGIQCSDNIGQEGIVPNHFGRDRSSRTYMQEPVPAWGFLLSDAYISLNAARPSLTALHLVHNGETTLGYVGADFDLRNLPVAAEAYEEPRAWRQIRGDPSIRATVFQQSRAESLMDRNIDQALSILEDLALEHGMFQTVINFSSSRATAWFMDDPLRYRLLDHEALADPDICLTYPRHAYPMDTLIPPTKIRSILAAMRELRLTDQTIYLRSASINVFNGMVSITFSCDGSHVMGYEEFLNRTSPFWLSI